MARPRTDVRYEPGGEWLYAKVYAVEPIHDAVLTRELPRLLAQLPDGIDRWFFVRYRDPDAHLRLRFHGDLGWALRTIPRSQLGGRDRRDPAPQNRPDPQRIHCPT